MKVLILSHNPVSAQSNMGKTFLTLFSGFAQEMMCQLYIYPTIPNQCVCSSYYRMTDKDMLNWLIKRKKIGKVFTAQDIRTEEGMFERAQDEAVYRDPKNKSPLRRLLRDLLWRLAKWKNEALDTWLSQEKPECIFVAPGAATFIHDIAIYISKKYNIPIVTYICDEYYFVKKPAFGLERIRVNLIQKKIRALLQQSTHLVVISEELKETYEKEFGVPTTVLMTGTSYPIAERTVESLPEEICYFGNIRCNRYLPLAQIGRELDQINGELGTQYRLKIYSGEKNEQILSHFRDIRSIDFCGFVSGQAFDTAFHNAQLLLHVEAFDEASIAFVRHSISTKIADCLGSGIPMVAYGPECVSSMQHLLRHKCALTATSGGKLRQMLLTAFSDPRKRLEAAENGLNVARQFHDSQIVSMRLKEIFESLRQTVRQERSCRYEDFTGQQCICGQKHR